MRDLSYSVKAEGLLKEYHIYDRPAERLKELFFKTKKHKVFKALGPLDIEVRKGETLGIIGENGAGKSTFLKLVAGVIEPSFGTIRVSGKVSSILELGTGFNPEFTGRENVLLNGSLLGLSSEEVNGRIERIANFADIGEFFDMPVKTYSSGMYMRLAFALAVYVDADIVVIDEALSVGDGAYQKKCIDRMWELKKNGTTVLFCSHSIYTITTFCDRAMWLKDGGVQILGDAKEVVSRYEDYLREKERIEDAGTPIMNSAAESRVAEVRRIELLTNGRAAEASVHHLSDLEVIVGFAVDRNDGLCCYADSMNKRGIKSFHGPGNRRLSISFNSFPLLGGVYKFVIFLLDDTGICVFDRKESELIRVHTSEKEWGVCHINHEWKLQ
jgi:lipopolysaccharide transport system ATP-binding protein